ncbi:MAG: type II toxin-antitoxin system RelE/ParE family toxin [Deltaproteobacteria bacterium]|nr:type II toxin-antitoxin system RelE/ParE family toxin [Deltaproteobacteria bacterium]
MIKNFIHKGLEKFFTTGSKAGIQARHEKRIRLILAQLNQAKTVEDMNIPTLALHQLKPTFRTFNHMFFELAIPYIVTCKNLTQYIDG